MCFSLRFSCCRCAAHFITKVFYISDSSAFEIRDDHFAICANKNDAKHSKFVILNELHGFVHLYLFAFFRFVGNFEMVSPWS